MLVCVVVGVDHMSKMNKSKKKRNVLDNNVETLFGDDSHIHWRRNAKNPMHFFPSRGTLRKIMGLGRHGSHPK